MAEQVEKDPYAGNWRMPKPKDFYVLIPALLIVALCVSYLVEHHVVIDYVLKRVR